MAKPDPSQAKKDEQRKHRKWIITIFFSTMLISGAISTISKTVMDNSTMIVAMIILMFIVLVGIRFDIVGMAVATADEKPFHSMAARKVKGAQECIMLLRNAERVSSICNDVIGDICGVVSGAASATIAAQILQSIQFPYPQLIPLILSSTVAAVTVGGKAIGKGIAISSCISIVYHAGQIIYGFHALTACLTGKNRRNKKNSKR